MVNYEDLVKEQIKKNCVTLTEEINSTSTRKKIVSFCEKFDQDFEEVREKILNDPIFACLFIKDPKKQNIYETIAAKYINGLTSVKNFVKLSVSALFMVKGKLVNERVAGTKSIDFSFMVKDKTIYVSHKYIKDNGGAQDNQYNDVLNFLKNCQGNDLTKSVFIAICDGKYFTKSKMETLKEFEKDNIFVMNINEFEERINDIC